MGSLGSIFLFVSPALAFPASPLPAPSGTGVEPTWVSEPEGRGTAGLLISCLVTYALCVWSVVHVDVVPRQSRRIAYKIVGMLLCIFFPQVVIFFASIEWKNAKRLQRQWCENFGVIPGSSEDLLGMKGAFFVIMGGFSLGPRKNFPDGVAPTLTPRGFINLTGSGVIPKNVLDTRLIEDKAKADTFAKFLICVQVFSIVIQCIARAVSRLPVTLLEINVVIHVLSTGIIYGYWWHKPVDIGEPIPVIDDRELGSLLSIVYDHPKKDLVFEVMPVSSDRGGSDFASLLKTFLTRPSSGLSHDALNNYLLEKNFLGNQSDLEIIGKSSNSEDTEQLSESRVLLKEDSDVELMKGETLFARDDFSVAYHGDLSTTLTGIDIENFRFAANAVRNGKYSRHPWNNTPIRLQTEKLGFLNRGYKWSERWSTRRLPENGYGDNHINKFQASLVLSFALLYSAWHALAWNSHFPTPLERLLWRVSCSILASLHVLFFLCFLSSRLRRFFVVFESLLWFILPLSFLFPSVYLVVEAFLSFRSLPEGSYKTVQWSEYWPHI